MIIFDKHKQITTFLFIVKNIGIKGFLAILLTFIVQNTQNFVKYYRMF